MITKIQSFSDVITNSSSSVFVMSACNADYYDGLPHTEGCIYAEKITWDWLLNNKHEFEMVCDMLKVSPSVITSEITSPWGYKYWDDVNAETWKAFLEMHKEELLHIFKDLYWVEIEDHFEGAYEVTEDAYDDAIWSDGRH